MLDLSHRYKISPASRAGPGQFGARTGPGWKKTGKEKPGVT